MPDRPAPPDLRCRSCGATLRDTFVDLGTSPLCQSVVRPADLGRGETHYPLHVYVCRACSLVQIDESVPPEAHFQGEYAYASSHSDSWVEHARRFVASAVERFGLGPESLVVEIASNDGYLLQHVVARGIPCLGVEPAANVASAAVERGVPTRVAFFDAGEAESMVAEGLRADLIVANNVLAHTPTLGSFLDGIARLLAPGGVASVEAPHLVRLVDEGQFDTIYHEHYSYFSFTAAERAFTRSGLAVVDVAELPTHGGSLRYTLAHAGAGRVPTPAVAALREREADWGVDRLETYTAFAERTRAVKRDLLDFLIDSRRAGRTVAGYGAPGKGNTLLNYCGIRTDLLDYTVDRNPYKQGTYTPGARIPVFAPGRVFETQPDYLLILPWNLRDEIEEQMAGIRAWGGQFVVPIPALEVW